MDTINFSEIPSNYRPLPFWSWNDLLDPAELRRQIRLMHDAGIGGFFMHARGGLQTVYLSKEWMECVNACLDEAAKLGMEAWLYDENGWPSGFCAGAVNALGEKFQQKSLRREFIDASTAADAEHTVAFYDENFALIGRTLPENHSGKVWRIYAEINPYYVDNLDPEVVKEFIRSTHEFYRANIPAHLLTHLRGIFTDEPQLVRDGIPWSDILENEYRKSYDRELLIELPALFAGGDDSAGVRIRFWKLVTRLFSENFMKQIHEWCSAGNWLLTGHHLLEETCQYQLSCNGAIMAHYQYYDMPGVDHLGRSEPSAVSQVQVVSAAAQSGKKQILTESFALTGWNFNFSGMKWLYQIQLVHGVNRLCQHLQGYTLRGIRKRDYPGSFFYHQPWWDEYRKVNDYFAFTGSVLAENPCRTDVLVVHPQSSAWVHYTGNQYAKILDFYTQSLCRITEALDSRFIAHHYADEQMSADYGSVDENGLLRIGKMSYKIVVIPMICNISREVLTLLQKFSACGGEVLMVRNTLEPERLLIDGASPDAKDAEYFNSLRKFDSEAGAAQYVSQLFPPEIRVSENGIPCDRLLGTSREISDFCDRSGKFYFIVSRQYRNSAAVTVSLPDSGSTVEVIDALSGKIMPVDGVERADGRISFEWYFAPGGSAMFIVSDAANGAAAVKMPDFDKLPAVKVLPEKFTLLQHSGNIFTLDRCRYRTDGGKWAGDDVIQVQTEVSKLRRECDLDIEYRFVLDDDFPLDTVLTLVTETPEKYRFNLNGRDFPGSDCGYLFDTAFRKIMLPGNLKHGENILLMSMRYTQKEGFYEQLEKAGKCETEYNKLTYETEIESVYLYGDFSVRHHGAVEKLTRQAVRFNGSFSLGAGLTGTVVNIADLPGAGMPFFSGRTTLQSRFTLTENEVKKISFLRFAPLGANTLKLKLNGTDLGYSFWGPFVINVSSALQPGENLLEVELVTSLRNTLGPHHLAEGESYAVGTMSFNRAEDAVGHKAPPYDPGYCFVELGIGKLELV